MAWLPPEGCNAENPGSVEGTNGPGYQEIMVLFRENVKPATLPNSPDNKWRFEAKRFT